MHLCEGLPELLPIHDTSILNKSLPHIELPLLEQVLCYHLQRGLGS